MRTITATETLDKIKQLSTAVSQAETLFHAGRLTEDLGTLRMAPIDADGGPYRELVKDGAVIRRMPSADARIGLTSDLVTNNGGYLWMVVGNTTAASDTVVAQFVDKAHDIFDPLLTAHQSLMEEMLAKSAELDAQQTTEVDSIASHWIAQQG